MTAGGRPRTPRVRNQELFRNYRELTLVPLRLSPPGDFAHAAGALSSPLQSSHAQCEFATAIGTNARVLSRHRRDRTKGGEALAADDLIFRDGDTEEAAHTSRAGQWFALWTQSQPTCKSDVVQCR
jgi:hypothetical protein